jgi:hypothetical protein
MHWPDCSQRLRHSQVRSPSKTLPDYGHPVTPSHSITSLARGRTDFGSPICTGFANPRQAWFASPVGVRPSSAHGGTVFGGNEAQVADDFIAAAMVRRMIDAVDHRYVGKIKRAHAF